MVICLHGFPDSANSFRYQIDDLLAAGFRVLTPTMRGYEPSSIEVNPDYSAEQLAIDVINWIKEMKLKQVHLVGHDWGAAVAYVAAARAPEKFLSLTTIAVPHPKRFSREGFLKVPVQGLKSWYMLFNQIPFLAEYVCSRKNWRFLRFLWQRWSPHQELGASEWQDLVATYERPGVMKAMLSYYRQNVSLLQLIGLKKSSLKSVEQISVPNLAITGTEDGCIDTRVFDYTILAKDHLAGFQLERIPNAGHFVHQEKPDKLNPLTINWLKQHNHEF